jgi:hypothetical protein
MDELSHQSEPAEIEKYVIDNKELWDIEPWIQTGHIDYKAPQDLSSYIKDKRIKHLEGEAQRNQADQDVIDATLVNKLFRDVEAYGGALYRTFKRKMLE